jgi:hypothetical protein
VLETCRNHPSPAAAAVIGSFAGLALVALFAHYIWKAKQAADEFKPDPLPLDKGLRASGIL